MFLCTEFEQRVSDFCTRVAGADAMVSSRVARNSCYAPAYTIMGGRRTSCATSSASASSGYRESHGRAPERRMTSEPNPYER